MTSKSHVKDTGPRAAGGVVIVVNYRQNIGGSDDRFSASPFRRKLGVRPDR
jgi:hypothetical protein